MSLNAAMVEIFFRDIGRFVRMHDLYGSDVPALVSAESALKRTRFGSGAERLETLGRALEADRNNADLVAALVDGEVNIVTDYVTEYVGPAIQSKGASASEILDELAERMLEECTPAQYVLRNEVAVDGAVAADTDNAGDGTLGSIVLSQYIAAQRFTVECVDASVEGSEVWSVTGSVVGELDQATTGVAYTDSNTYLELAITAGAAAFAVGDKFYFYTTCTERRFQTFFRDYFEVVMPSVGTGSETIDEDWAA